MDNEDETHRIKSPYIEINQSAIDKLEKRKSGISVMDVRSFLLWTLTMEALPPNWIFIGNKPSIRNVTFIAVRDNELLNDDVLSSLCSVPVRKAPIPASWDQFLLYGIQSLKRSRPTGEESPVEKVSYSSMCLTEEELQTNNYMVVKSKEHHEELANDGFLFIKDACKEALDEYSEDDLLALDCEMVETRGQRDELAHVSIVSTKGILYDKYVKPEGEITDYRTEWSGITPEIIENCTNSFSVIQKEVFHLLTQKPIILVGHSLENDLSVLKIVPDHVIDTAVRYTHPTPGFKHSLRYLTSHYLNRSIQNASRTQTPNSDTKNLRGHDPAEDARAALDLTIFFNSGGIEFRKSFTESKPFLNRHNCLLQQISKANPGKRIAFMGWNDYVMSVSQMSTVGDMFMLKNTSSISTKVRSLSRSTNLPLFTYVFGAEYHFAEVNQVDPIKNSCESPLDLNEFMEMFKSYYKECLLCLLVMKSDFDESAIGGRFYVSLNSG